MRTDHGFTLIEMLVVIAIVALIAAFALPQFSGAEAKADMTSTARRLAAGLRNTRSLAMTQGRAETFALDTAHGLYRSGAGAAQAVDKNIGVTLVTAAQERIGTATGSIRFFADGSSTGGGIGLQAGTRNALILVDWLTGRVSIVDGANASPR